MVTEPETNKSTNTHGNRQDRSQYTAPLSLARSVITAEPIVSLPSSGQRSVMPPLQPATSILSALNKLKIIKKRSEATQTLRTHKQTYNRRSTIGDRAFFVAAPRVWNSLPSSVTAPQTLGTFRRRLKTHLFAVSLT